ncbi:TonB-dependent siderophore receptor [Thermocoleostomius sinensis]|uniref:TonB-dependent siderophore receptor n=1 Tax=Thermocoleostomius sinensis A174 TaxID=2016057 RepID=A0A9E8ZIR2_9CYAN|nr:TonB-dependent siderophore receptor [Thermocoleostomius sinensis]WAL61995.1 TonB-dependent siderophore receptor [Thermocoleostomius sinensis A174]
MVNSIACSPPFLGSLLKIFLTHIWAIVVCGVNQMQRSMVWMFVLGLVASPAWAGVQGVVEEANAESGILAADIPQLSTLEQPATTLEEWQVEIAQSLVQVTGVQVDITATGLDIILESTGQLAEPSLSVVGNALIADISNAILALPEGNELQQTNPIEGVALVSITQRSDGVRVAITGTVAPPTANIRSDGQGLVLSVAPGTEAAETNEAAIQVVVTGELDQGYAPSNATTATRTDTPLRDIPQSIQVVPQQVLQDRRVSRISEALESVSGVQADDSFGGTLDRINIRGFQADVFLENGFRRNAFSSTGLGNAELIERVEVLKGPASVLYGNIEPGGVVNIVTEQPLAEPRYQVEGEVGSFGLISPSLDLTGPLNEARTLLYRLNALYEVEDGFRDYNQNLDRFVIAPSLTWNLSENTNIIFDVFYAETDRPFDRGIPAIGDRVADIPRDRLFQNPDTLASTEEVSISYRLEHRFNENWRLRNAFRYLSVDTFDFRLESWTIEDSGRLDQRWRSNDDYQEFYSLQTNVVGEFNTGPIEHTLLAGIDLNRSTSVGQQQRLPGDPSFFTNIFTAGAADVPRPSTDELTLIVRNNNNRQDNLGIFVQDQIAFTDNLKLLIGGRFDIFGYRALDLTTNSTTEDTVERFTPRVGIVYQPIEPLSLYASYSQAFSPNLFDVTADGSVLNPEISEQFEIGIRGEFLNDRLIANLAVFEITKQNVAAPDPDNPDFSLAVGEIRSRGIEFDIAGEIFAGWNIIASYAYVDAEVTEETFIPVGNTPDNVADHTASLWTTYEIQAGTLQGLGFGLGLFYVNNRPGDFENTYELSSYLRTDAALFYRRDNWRAALNFQNLFDVDYIRYSEGFREANTPGQPFSVIGSISVTF